ARNSATTKSARFILTPSRRIIRGVAQSISWRRGWPTRAHVRFNRNVAIDSPQTRPMQQRLVGGGFVDQPFNWPIELKKIEPFVLKASRPHKFIAILGITPFDEHWIAKDIPKKEYEEYPSSGDHSVSRFAHARIVARRGGRARRAICILFIPG